eukprot:NODE_547_length_6851_cov_0.322867.p2 type:complete len:383 gc:universal NODE_547_length_6851_cov_0.322867:5001-3853(-)
MGPKSFSSIKLFCSTCNRPPTDVIEDFKQGDLICGDCGLILSDGRLVDSRSEWRNFSDESANPARAGHAADPILGANRQLDTVISENGRGLNLQRIHIRNTANSLDKQLIAGIQELEIMSNQMSLPKRIVDMSKENLRKILEGGFAKGKDPIAVKAVCILIASRQAGVNRSFKEISHSCRVSKKELGRVFKLVDKPLADSMPEVTGVQGVAAEQLLSRYCSQLTLSQKIENMAIFIATKAREVLSLSSRSPLSVASGAILLACHIMGDPTTCRQISGVTGVSDTTIKHILKLMFKNHDTLCKSEWNVHVPHDLQWSNTLDDAATTETVLLSPSVSQTASDSGVKGDLGTTLSASLTVPKKRKDSGTLPKKKRKLVTAEMLML